MLAANRLQLLHADVAELSAVTQVNVAKGFAVLLVDLYDVPVHAAGK
ncbi:hypothetical protein ACX80Z_11530 [Arthrobacter sp. TMT4-20]